MCEAACLSLNQTPSSLDQGFTIWITQKFGKVLHAPAVRSLSHTCSLPFLVGYGVSATSLENVVPMVRAPTDAAVSSSFPPTSFSVGSVDGHQEAPLTGSGNGSGNSQVTPQEQKTDGDKSGKCKEYRDTIYCSWILNQKQNSWIFSNHDDI